MSGGTDWSEWIPLIAVAAGCAVNAGTNFSLLRYQQSMGSLATIRIGAVAGLFAFTAIALVFRPASSSPPSLDWTVRLACAALSYLSMAYLFFGYVVLPEISVRLRILQELADHGGLTRQEILTKYGSAEILRLRLDRLTKSGQLVRRGDRYITGRPRLLYVAKSFWLLKRLLLHGVVDHNTHLPRE